MLRLFGLRIVIMSQTRVTDNSKKYSHPGPGIIQGSTIATAPWKARTAPRKIIN